MPPALGALGATRDYDGRWQSPAGVVVPTRYRSILDAAAGTTDAEITRRQMIGLLTVAGYSRNSAVGRMSSSHPLFVRTGPNRYRIVGSNQRYHVPAGTV